jgi:hypothetical protein
MVDRSVGGAWGSLMAGNCPSMARNVDFEKLQECRWSLRGLIDLRGPGCELVRGLCDALPPHTHRKDCCKQGRL